MKGNNSNNDDTSVGKSNKGARATLNCGRDDDSGDAMQPTHQSVKGSANGSEVRPPASPNDTHRLRLSPSSVDGKDENSVAAEPRRLDELTQDQPSTSAAQPALPAIQKRAKDEVDVAAAGIPLEVRRLQTTKSTLALKEATKNDATPQSSKLVDYLVSLTHKDSRLFTEKEICEWLVAQLCDRMETGQAWVIAKSSSLLFELLWRGSGGFVTAVHDYGAALFQTSRIAELAKRTPQENLAGDRLPSLLQPRDSSAGASASTAGMAKPPMSPSRYKSTQNNNDKTVKKLENSVSDISEDEMSFFISNTAYMESLCEYRMRHPTLDVAHGEILSDCTGDEAAAAAQNKRTYSPATWKGLLDDTLELMKAIAVMDPCASLGAISVSAATSRVRESVLLYQIACRALVRLLHSTITTIHTFIASVQAGLQVPSSSADSPGSPTTSTMSERDLDYFGESFQPNTVDISLTPEYMRGLAANYYNAIYQFNRTVNMLKTHCETNDHVDKEVARKAVTAFKVLPEASILEFKESRKTFTHPVFYKTVRTLYEAAQQTLAERTGGQLAKTAAESHLDATLAPSPSTSLPPMSAEEVRHSMIAFCDFHTANDTFKNNIWAKQVDGICGLFDEKESQMLHQIFNAGLTGLFQQWQEFTNNGAAAAEKALTASTDTRSISPRGTSVGSLRGELSSDNGFSDAVSKTSTYIPHSLPSGVRVRASSGTKTDVITLERSGSLESSTESAIDALLQEDDVVVICNEECSCNDKLKLVDRFQVLRDVPMGEGSYGKVYRAWDEVVGCYLAAKELPLDASKAHNVAVREVLQEYTVLTELSHPNIVRVVAFMVLRLTARIYMEWMPSGSLQDVLRHHPRGMLRESVVRRYARDVLSGLAFLHSRGVIHRDVKPGNMLLSSDGTVKLTDFGTSLVLSGNHRTLESSSVTGTAAYMAPECVQGTYSSASDIWSFGCSVVHLVSGTVPWCSPTTGSTWEPIALLFKIGNLDDTTHLERPHDALKAAAKDTEAALDGDSFGSTTPAAAVDVDAADATEETSKSTKGVSAELLDMLDAIFVVDRRKRPSATELLQYPFFAVN
ncbi:protein kinase [Lotmaria passim]